MAAVSISSSNASSAQLRMHYKVTDADLSRYLPHTLGAMGKQAAQPSSGVVSGGNPWRSGTILPVSSTRACRFLVSAQKPRPPGVDPGSKCWQPSQYTLPVLRSSSLVGNCCMILILAACSEKVSMDKIYVRFVVSFGENHIYVHL